jgi:hypothetical protein
MAMIKRLLSLQGHSTIVDIFIVQGLKKSNSSLDDFSYIFILLVQAEIIGAMKSAGMTKKNASGEALRSWASHVGTPTFLPMCLKITGYEVMAANSGGL